MNICTVVHSTNCEVSLSTGQAVETPSDYGPPAPTEGGDGDENTNTPAEPTNGGASETGGEDVTTEVLPTVTETSSIYPTAGSTTTDEESTGYDETATSTEGEEPSASGTDSAPPGESTAAAAHFGAPVVVLGAMVVGLI